MILTKYAPASTKDVVGNQTAIREITGWLAHWTKGHALLVHGPVGTGKTSTIRLIAKEHGYEILEAAATATVTAASGQRSIFGKKKLMLIENIETISMRGFSELLKASSHPIICTTTDAYKLSPSVRKLFRTVKFEKPGETDMLCFAAKICENENIEADERKLTQLVRVANGDLRAMLIDLDAVRLGMDVKDLGYRNFEENVFNTIKLIFKTMSIENARIALENSEKDAEELFLWLENNIVDEYTDIDSIASAYNYLSKADVFAARIIRRQSWSLSKYVADLTVYGTALSKKRPSARFVAYRPPFFARKVSKSAMVKIAVGLHTSATHAREYIPIIKMHPDVCEKLGLDENETDSILGSS